MSFSVPISNVKIVLDEKNNVVRLISKDERFHEGFNLKLSPGTQADKSARSILTSEIEIELKRINKFAKDVSDDNILIDAEESRIETSAKITSSQRGEELLESINEVGSYDFSYPSNLNGSIDVSSKDTIFNLGSDSQGNSIRWDIDSALSNKQAPVLDILHGGLYKDTRDSLNIIKETLSLHCAAHNRKSIDFFWISPEIPPENHRIEGFYYIDLLDLTETSLAIITSSYYRAERENKIFFIFDLSCPSLDERKAASESEKRMNRKIRKRIQVISRAISYLQRRVESTKSGIIVMRYENEISYLPSDYHPSHRLFLGSHTVKSAYETKMGQPFALPVGNALLKSYINDSVTKLRLFH